MATQQNAIGVGAAIVGADGNAADYKYKPNPRLDRVFDKTAVDKSFEALRPSTGARITTRSWRLTMR